MRRSEPSVISVVIPAHDEQDLLPAALRALSAAREMTAVEIEILVVADRCQDRTAEVARDHGVAVLEIEQANVGLARAAGFTHTLRRHARRLGSVWLASTDADSRVPPDWFEAHRAAAASGADVHLGTVVLAEADRGRARAWIEAYDARARLEEFHGHVHGANIGMRALAYERVGGFAPLAVGEDADLVERLAQGGATVTWCTGSPVTTSARLVGRAPGGVAADLSRCLDQAVAMR